MVDATGLAVGLIGLPNDLLDLHERWDSARDFDSQYRQALNTWDLSQIRLQDWISHAGFDGEKLEDDHHPRLDDPDVFVSVKNNFASIRDITHWLGKRQAKLRINSTHTEELSSQMKSLFLNVPGSGHGTRRGRHRSPSPLRGFLSWATHGKQFAERVNNLATIVARLFEFVPLQRLLGSGSTFHEPTQEELSSGTSYATMSKPHSNVSLPDDESAEALPEIVKLLRELQINEIDRLEKFVTQRNQIDAWLNVPRVDQEYDKFLSSRLDGTCDWIFHHPSYTSWSTTDSSSVETGRVLWIHGPPGFGKTLLCARIVEVLREKYLTAYAFCSAYVQAGQKPDVVMRIWISQLTRQSPVAHEVVWKHLTALGSTEVVASQVKMQAVLKSILSKLRGCTLTLDGLDEFERSGNLRGELLETLMTTIAHTNTRVLITSRVDISPEISSAMAGSTDPVLLEYGLSEEDVRLDITKFSDHIVNKKLPSQQAKLRNDLANQMVEKAGGMFLWVKMQEPQLEDYKSKAALQKVISKMPKGLYQTYERTWKEIWNLSEDDQERAIAILRWAAFAFRPLTVSELTEALLVDANMEPEDLDLDDNPFVTEGYINRGIKRLCGSFVEIRTSGLDCSPGTRTVHIVHASARDYILLPPQSDASSIQNNFSLSDVRSQHIILAKICLKFVSNEAVWKLLDSGFRKYATTSWPIHVCAAGGEDSDVIDCVNRLFLRQTLCFRSWRQLHSLTEPRIDHRTSKAGGPLYYASLFNLTATMKALKDQPETRLDEIGGAYGTALQAACVKGNEEAFNALLDWGADPNVEAGIFGSALIAAISEGRENMVAQLLKLGADPTLVRDDEIVPTALYAAVRCNIPSLVELLLESGAEPSISVPNKHGWTSLNVAAIKGELTIVRLLLQYQADPNIPQKSGWSALIEAASQDNVEISKVLLENHADPNSIIAKTGWTPLLCATRKGNVELVKLLLGYGADPTVANFAGHTPLYLAAGAGNLELMHALLDHDANRFPVNAFGTTPLMHAVVARHVATASLLLQKGAGVSHCDESGWTALHHAVRSGDGDVVKLLLEYGADPSRTISLNGADPGHTPLSVWTADCHQKAADFLMDTGLSLESLFMVPEFETPFNRAAFTGNLKILKLLFEKYPEGSTTCDKHGRTALHLAALGGRAEVFDYLYEQEIDPLAQDEQGQTILHSAAASGSLEMVQRVLQLPHATKLLENKALWTPLHWAARNGSSDLIHTLIRAGASETCVKVSDPLSSFTPWAIAQFHSNEQLVSDADCPLTKDNGLQVTARIYSNGFICNACELVCFSLKPH